MPCSEFCPGFSPATCEATFVVSSRRSGESFYVPPVMAVRAFGKPRATYRYAGYTIMTWPDNLLARLRSGPSPVISTPWMVGH